MRLQHVSVAIPAGVATRAGSALVGRPRFTCRDPFGNLIELTRLEGT